MTNIHLLHYDVIMPRQSQTLLVFTFAAPRADVARFARVQRAGRDETGTLYGFQRPQIANHIREIRDYLEKTECHSTQPCRRGFHRRCDP